MLTSNGDRNYITFLASLMLFDFNDDLIMIDSLTIGRQHTIEHQGNHRMVELTRTSMDCFVYYTPKDKVEVVHVYDGHHIAQRVYNYLCGKTEVI